MKSSVAKYAFRFFIIRWEYFSDLYTMMGTLHIKMCSDVKNRLKIRHKIMCSDVQNRVGTPHIKCTQMFKIGWGMGTAHLKCAQMFRIGLGDRT